MSILRTKCDFNWTTPFGSSRNLPINCAYDSSETWPGMYRWTKTIGTTTPVTSTGLDVGPGFQDNEACDEGQTVYRAFFAYVATEPFITRFELSASASPAWDSDSPYRLRENISLTAKLYSPTTALLETFIDTDEHEAEGVFTLPATTCPKVVWLNASIQPTGSKPDLFLPATSVAIRVS